MNDLTTTRRALAGRAALLARTAGRAMSRDERRLLARYNRDLDAPTETRTAQAVSVEIMSWCAARPDQSIPMTAQERSDYERLVTEHRAAAQPAPAPATPLLDLRRRRAALTFGA